MAKLSHMVYNGSEFQNHNKVFSYLDGLEAKNSASQQVTVRVVYDV